MFYGTFEHALDDKNRLMIPSKLREEIPAAEGGVFYVTQGLDRCLFAYTKKGFDDIVGRFRAGKDAYKSANARNFLRLFFSSTRREELDAQGRLLLPEDLRARSGLRRDVVLVGVMDRIELWDRQRWGAFQRSNRDRYEKFAELAELFG